MYLNVLMLNAFAFSRYASNVFSTLFYVLVLNGMLFVFVLLWLLKLNLLLLLLMLNSIRFNLFGVVCVVGENVIVFVCFFECFVVCVCCVVCVECVVLFELSC